MTTVNQKRIRKTKTSRLSPLSPSPSKIRLSTTDETELASELTDEIQIASVIIVGVYSNA